LFCAAVYFFEKVFHFDVRLKKPDLSVACVFHSVKKVFTLILRHFMEKNESGLGPSRRARGRPRGWNGTQDESTVKSLDRAIRIWTFVSEMRGMTLSAIADQMDESPATVYRVLVTLERQGLVEFDTIQQSWHIGPTAFVIGARFLRRTSLVERARPIMRRLMEVTGETANLGVERNGAVLFLSQVETHASIRAFFPPGTLSPIHASGIGKALLAQMDTAQRDRCLANAGLEAFTQHTIVRLADLLANLQLIRERGFSYDNEERTLGMRCIAAPVFDINNEAVAGISVSGPTSRVSEATLKELTSPVITAARELTVAIGGLPPDGS
jgi:IclR family acetate operon transcriptional repressor